MIKKAPLEGMSGAKWSSPKQRPSEKRPGRRKAAISETGTREEERSGVSSKLTMAGRAASDKRRSGRVAMRWVRGSLRIARASGGAEGSS
jgi:hypothetical protein